MPGQGKLSVAPGLPGGRVDAFIKRRILVPKAERLDIKEKVL